MWAVVLASLVANFFLPEVAYAANSDTCDGTKLLNSAFVFVKPHANTPATRDLVSQKLVEAGMSILSEADISGVEIDQKGLIDQHYFSIASKATILPARKIPVPTDKFEEAFGESWERVLKENRACNAMEACKRFECSSSELNDAWQKVEAKKFGGGFYCARFSVNGKPDLYVFNAFFMAMRSKFVGEENAIHCYVVEWDPSKLSWASFRNDILGPTDPREAPNGSIRRTILDQYRELGLSAQPNKGDNGVHASASAFEGLAEKSNWLGQDTKDDSFGRSLLDAGVSEMKLKSWFNDPQIKLTKSIAGSVFDALEDMDVEECLQKLIELSKLN